MPYDDFNILQLTKHLSFIYFLHAQIYLRATTLSESKLLNTIDLCNRPNIFHIYFLFHYLPTTLDDVQAFKHNHHANKSIIVGMQSHLY